MRNALGVAVACTLLSVSPGGCRVEDGRAAEVQPADRPGSERILFSSDRDGPLQLYLLSLVDGSIQRVTWTSRDERHPSVAPGGARVVYQSDSGRVCDLYALELGEPGSVRLTTTGKEREPSFSRDGRRIAFTSGRDGDSAIYVMEADGSSPARLSPENARDRSPAFSTEGNRILFVASSEGESDLCVMNADGSDRRILVRMAGDESDPCWAPDDTWLAFAATAAANGRHDEIVRIGADGTSRKELTSSGSMGGDAIDRNRANWGPQVDPTGSRVVFCSLRDGDAELYSMRSDGSSLRRLTEDPAQDLDPTWIRP